jgi:hypothetical protein
VAPPGEQPVLPTPAQGTVLPYDHLTWAYAVGPGMLIVGFVFFWHAEDKPDE